MANCVLRKLNQDDEEIYSKFVAEFKDAGEKIIPAGADKKERTFLEWLQENDDYSKGINLPENRVPATLLFLVDDENKKIIGAIDIRHELNEYLLEIGGNIGYGVAPSERRKGYANQMLAMALEYCRKLKLNKVLITCDKDNIGSAKTIQKAGGVLENEVSADDGVIKQRYWIEL